MSLVARHSVEFPAISISVDFSNSQNLAEKLIKYELDVAVLGRIKHQPKFYALPWTALGFYAGPRRGGDGLPRARLGRARGARSPVREK
jgi:hypothetical protein